MQRFVLTLVLLVLAQVGSLGLRYAVASLSFEHAAVAGLASLVGVGLLLDARHRFSLAKAGLIAGVPVVLGPWFGRWGVAAIAVWCVVYAIDLRRRGRAVDPAALRCPRCRSSRVEVTSPPEHYCHECGHTFDRFEL